MIQDQLVEYISSQLKLGISRDAVKSALVGVGWAPLDVEDTLKKVEGATMSPAAQPIVPPKTAEVAGTVASASPKFVSFSAPGMVVGQTKNPEPQQTVRVSDLVSSVAPVSGTPTATANASKVAPAMTMSADIGKTSAITQKNPLSKVPSAGNFSAYAAPMVQKKSGSKLVEILEAVVVVVLCCLAGYLFYKNNNLNNQLQAINGQNQGIAQGSATQLQMLDASNTALTTEVASITAENQDLMTNLSFFILPTGSSSTVSSTQVSVSGVLSAGLGKNTYIVTTQYGAKTYVKNSSQSGVAAALQPLLGTTIQISGTYIPGTPNITVTSINGSPISAPTIATTTAAVKTNIATTTTP
jgi:hypothetical protein